MGLAPGEKTPVIVTKAIFMTAVGHVELRSPFHRVVPRVDSDVRGDRAEFADVRIYNLVVTGGIGVISDRRLDNRAVWPSPNAQVAIINV